MGKDPAFLFYDADAARDVSHMNRLERGAYFDVMQAQKKFGRMTIHQIKKILGNDYETCWPSVAMVMIKADQRYFIQWVEESVQKRENYRKSRSVNRSKKHSAEVVPVELMQTGAKEPLVQRMAVLWRSMIKNYAFSIEDDYPALLDFAKFICKQMSIPNDFTSEIEPILKKWNGLVDVIAEHASWKSKSLSNLAKFNKQEIYALTMQAPQEKRMVI